MKVYLDGDPVLYCNYRRAVEQAGGAVQFGGVPQACGALLLPGGGDLEPRRYGQEDQGSRDPDPKRDERELCLLEQFIQSGKPILGICRGLQVINVFFGGTLIQDLPGHGMVNGADRVHAVRTADPRMKRLCGGEWAAVNSAHHQAVDLLGKGLQVLQRAEDGVVEAFCHETLPILALQWHPERLYTRIGSGVFQTFLDSGFFRK